MPKGIAKKKSVSQIPALGLKVRQYINVITLKFVDKVYLYYLKEVIEQPGSAE